MKTYDKNFGSGTDDDLVAVSLSKVDYYQDGLHYVDNDMDKIITKCILFPKQNVLSKGLTAFYKILNLGAFIYDLSLFGGRVVDVIMFFLISL